MIPKPDETPLRPSAPADERISLEGWATVENEMLKHDESTMKGHISDVDTLLVFAGLFSAVLTAFVVESYQKLQLDTNQGSMLVLRRISVQLESFTFSSGFLNSSESAPPLPSLDFVAETTIRWINILWFLSLIFGLAAALFGILVKQWIREYMQWNSALALPRDNVLVRQIRFEAWNDWHVPATIAVIPALLETALVFFVCGLVILLWTLDFVVSIVITTAAAVFLTIASTFTILPAFFERCPYKSPTAWACAVVWDIITLWIPHAISRLCHEIYLSSDSKFTEAFGEWLKKAAGLGNWRLEKWTAISGHWRARDLAKLWSSLAPSTNLKRGDATALVDELLSEQSCEDKNHVCKQKLVFITPWTSQAIYNNAQLPLHDALRTITELPPLVRALAWVSQASQDARVLRNVADCVESLASRFTLEEPMIETNQGGFALTQEGVHGVSIWHLLVSFGRNRGVTLAREDKAFLKDVSAFRARNVKHSAFPRECSGYGEGEGVQTHYMVRSSHPLLPAKDCRPAVLMLMSLCTSSLKMIVEDLLASLADRSSHSMLQSARRVMELLTMVYSFGDLDTRDPFVKRVVGRLVDVLRATNGEQREQFESQFPGLRHSVYTVAQYLGADRTGALWEEWFDPLRGVDDTGPDRFHIVPIQTLQASSDRAGGKSKCRRRGPQPSTDGLHRGTRSRLLIHRLPRC